MLQQVIPLLFYETKKIAIEKYAKLFMIKNNQLKIFFFFKLVNKLC